MSGHRAKAFSFVFGWDFHFVCLVVGLVVISV